MRSRSASISTRVSPRARRVSTSAARTVSASARDSRTIQNASSRAWRRLFASSRASRASFNAAATASAAARSFRAPSRSSSSTRFFRTVFFVFSATSEARQDSRRSSASDSAVSKTSARKEASTSASARTASATTTAIFARRRSSSRVWLSVTTRRAIDRHADSCAARFVFSKRTRASRNSSRSAFSRRHARAEAPRASAESHTASRSFFVNAKICVLDFSSCFSCARSIRRARVVDSASASFSVSFSVSNRALDVRASCASRVAAMRAGADFAAPLNSKNVELNAQTRRRSAARSRHSVNTSRAMVSNVARNASIAASHVSSAVRVKGAESIVAVFSFFCFSRRVPVASSSSASASFFKSFSARRKKNASATEASSHRSST